MPASALRMRGRASPTIGIAGCSSSLGVTCESMSIVGVGVMPFTGDSSVMVVGVGDRGGGVVVVTTRWGVGFGRGKAVGAG